MPRHSRKSMKRRYKRGGNDPSMSDDTPSTPTNRSRLLTEPPSVSQERLAAIQARINNRREQMNNNSPTQSVSNDFASPPVVPRQTNLMDTVSGAVSGATDAVSGAVSGATGMFNNIMGSVMGQSGNDAEQQGGRRRRRRASRKVSRKSGKKSRKVVRKTAKKSRKHRKSRK